MKYYNFNLDKAPSERWVEIFEQNESLIKDLKKHIQSLLKAYSSSILLLKPFFNSFDKSKIMYYEEITYIAKRIGLSKMECVLMQLMYESSAACTTAVIKINKKEFFLRTMDWPQDFMKDITIGLNIIKNSKVIAKATSWIGYVGLLTASKIDPNYTISINYRRTKDITLQSLTENLIRAYQMRWPIGHLIRSIMEEDYSVSTAKSMLEEFQLISPCYFILYVPGKKSYVITRDPDKAVHVRADQLVQANCDFDKTFPNILWSLERVQLINKMEEKLNSYKTKLSSEEILKHLLVHPVLNEETVYIHYQYEDDHHTIINK